MTFHRYGGSGGGSGGAAGSLEVPINWSAAAAWTGKDHLLEPSVVSDEEIDL